MFDFDKWGFLRLYKEKGPLNHDKDDEIRIENCFLQSKYIPEMVESLKIWRGEQ